MNRAAHAVQNSRSFLPDHELVLKLVRQTGKLLAGGTARTRRTAAAGLQRFCQTELPAHFSYEEHRIFPALATAIPSPRVARRLATLRTDHDTLLETAETLSDLLANYEPHHPAPARLRRQLAVFQRQLQRHSLRENELMPSLL